MHDVYRRIGLPLPPEVALAAAVAGRVVFNERAMCHVSDVLGMPRSWAQVISGGPGAATNAFVRPDMWKVLRRLDVVVRMTVFATGAERKARAHIRALRARYDGRAAVPLERLDDAALVARASHAWACEIHESLVIVMRVALAFQQVLSAGAMALEAHPAPAALLARLLDPDLVSVSTRQLEDLLELARALRGWEGGAAFLAEVGPEHAGRGHWRSQLPPALWTSVEVWLERYGPRGPYESDGAQPRYVDDLRLLASALRPLVRDPEGGDVLRVDGTDGKVEIVERSESA